MFFVEVTLFLDNTDIFHYQNIKKDWFVNILVAVCGIATSIYYQPSYRNIKKLKPLKNGFVLLPNHQSGLDIIFEGLLLRRAIGRDGYYITKDSLPKFLEHGGSVFITRGKEVIERKFRDERRQILEEAKEKRDYLLKIMEYLLANKEIVVLHQQGTRIYKSEFSINNSNLKKLLKVQERLGQQIPFVPLTISYEDIKRPFSRVIIDVGNPIQVPDNGLEALAEHLKKEFHIQFQ